MAINEIVRVQVIIENAESAVQQVELTSKSVDDLKGAFESLRKTTKGSGKAVEETFDQLNKKVEETITRLRGDLNNALNGLPTTIGKVRAAQLQLNKAFLDATNPSQIRRIAELRRRFDGLEQELVEAGEATDVFQTQLRGFGAAGSGGAASLIQLTRGIEDLRFGAAFAINNIEPFLTSLNRLEKISKATGVTVRQQLVGALISPVGVLFAFQAVLTAAVLLEPVISSLFDDGISDAKAFNEALEEAIDQLIKIDREEFTITIQGDVSDIEDNLSLIENAIENQELLARSLGTIVTEVVGGQLIATRELTEEEEERKEEIEGTIDALELIQTKLQDELRITNAINAAREAGTGTLFGTIEDADLQAIEDEIQDTVDKLIKEQEQRERELDRLRKQLDRELIETRLENIEDEEERAIQAARNEFAERIRLARELGDEAALAEFETALQTRIDQIQREFADERAKQAKEDAEKLARIQEQLQRQLATFRAKSLEDELEEAIALEEERFRRAFDLAREANDPDALAELHRLLEERKLQITEEFAQKRADAEVKELERVAREAERVAREAEREFQSRIRDVQLFSDAVVFSIADAARDSRRISEEEAELTRREFARQEEELRTSLERRLVTQEDFDFEVRQLNLRRSEFEKELEEDRRTFIEKSALNLLQTLIDIGLQELSAFIAQRTAALIFAETAQAAATASTVASQAAIAAAAAPAAAAVSISTFGAAAATGAAAANAAILQITGLVRALQSSAGFEEGGYTGRLDRHTIAGVVHGGEYVFPAGVVEGNVRAFRYLDAMLRKGLDMRELLHMIGAPGFQFGGFVPTSSQIDPTTLFRETRRPQQDNPATTQLTAEVGRLNRILSDLVRHEPTVRVEPLQSRKITSASRTQTFVKVPRRNR